MSLEYPTTQRNRNPSVRAINITSLSTAGRTFKQHSPQLNADIEPTNLMKDH